MVTKEWQMDSEEFVRKIRQIESFCKNKDILYKDFGDGCADFSFSINGNRYFVSNYKVPKSEKSKEVKYIFAGKLRIKEIYNDLKNGIPLDCKGFRDYKRIFSEKNRLEAEQDMECFSSEAKKLINAMQVKIYKITENSYFVYGLGISESMNLDELHDLLMRYYKSVFT